MWTSSRLAKTSLFTKHMKYFSDDDWLFNFMCLTSKVWVLFFCWFTKHWNHPIRPVLRVCWWSSQVPRAQTQLNEKQILHFNRLSGGKKKNLQQFHHFQAKLNNTGIQGPTRDAAKFPHTWVGITGMPPQCGLHFGLFGLHRGCSRVSEEWTGLYGAVNNVRQTFILCKIFILSFTEGVQTKYLVQCSDFAG